MSSRQQQYPPSTSKNLADDEQQQQEVEENEGRTREEREEFEADRELIIIDDQNDGRAPCTSKSVLAYDLLQRQEEAEEQLVITDDDEEEEGDDEEELEEHTIREQRFDGDGYSDRSSLLSGSEEEDEGESREETTAAAPVDVPRPSVYERRLALQKRRLEMEKLKDLRDGNINDDAPVDVPRPSVSEQRLALRKRRLQMEKLKIIVLRGGNINDGVNRSLLEAETLEQFNRITRLKTLFAYDAYGRISMDELSEASRDVLNRAVEYMRLYLLRYEAKLVGADELRRMLFAARIFGAPLQRLSGLPNVECLRKLGIPQYHNRPINLRLFFNAMSELEQRFGNHQWESFFLTGLHFIISNPKTLHMQLFFRHKILSIVRTLHKAALNADWPAAAECIAKIQVILPNHQKHSPIHFKFFSLYMGLYTPSIYLLALQCLLESKQSIKEMSRQFFDIFNAFLSTCSKAHQWTDNYMFYYSHLLTFHLCNLRLERRHSEDDPLTKAASAVRLRGDPEQRRTIILIDYCIDVERHLIQLAKQHAEMQHNSLKHEEQQSLQIRDRSLKVYFHTFLDVLMEEPQCIVGLLPITVFCAKQFDCVEELTEKLLEECARFPYLLKHVHNVFSRFNLDHVAGQILYQFFDLSLETLAAEPFILDLVEQRSLEPTNFGNFDSIIGGNLRALFLFLDHGRNRTDVRAWALLFSNISYVKDNQELVDALILPYWQKRKDWWPRFHSIDLFCDDALNARKQTFQLLEQIFPI